jgi:hypothetical protein
MSTQRERTMETVYTTVVAGRIAPSTRPYSDDFTVQFSVYGKLLLDTWETHVPGRKRKSVGKRRGRELDKMIGLKTVRISSELTMEDSYML